MALMDLAEEAVAFERGAPITEINEEDVLNVYMALYHAHAPKLADFKAIEYDQEADIVALVEDADRVGQFLKSIGNGP